MGIYRVYSRDFQKLGVCFEGVHSIPLKAAEEEVEGLGHTCLGFRVQGVDLGFQV